MIPTKVCPVLIRIKDDEMQILAFHHPLAGNQLVKGTIEISENSETAALRELYEESGIDNAGIVKDLGVWDSGLEGQIWAVYLCEAAGLSNEWVYRTKDDGGQDFAFFWHPLKSEFGECHQLYRNALRWIEGRLSET